MYYNNYIIKTILLKGEPLGFVCQNIQYFFNGEKNSWSKNRGDYGLETYDPKLNVYDKVQVELRGANLVYRRFYDV